MLSEDETEAVMLGLGYVDQRGDEVLKKAATVALDGFQLREEAVHWNRNKVNAGSNPSSPQFADEVRPINRESLEIQPEYI